MFKKLLALMLALCLMAGGLVLAAVAEDGEEDGLVLILEENFEEYEKDVNVSSTLMPNFFVCDYNTIGDGIISVQEDTTGNLYLKSHVFTQIYNDTPIVGAYEFSMTTIIAQGNVQSGIYIRAPKTNAAYYEGDGYPDTSTCQGGLLIYPHANSIGVNVKTYDKTASTTAFLQNNTHTFPLPQGVSQPYDVRVTDSGEEIAIYVNDTLICRITMSDPGKTYDKHESTGACFGAAKMYDAQGIEVGSYTDPLLCSDGSIIGWSTRNAIMSVDNVRVKVNKAHQALLAINKLPATVTEKNLEDVKELAATARELYDALTEDQKALVSNLTKLTSAEASIAELEPATEVPTDPVTEPVTEPETQPETVPETLPETEPVTEAPTSAPESEAVTDEELTDTAEPEVKVIDDSLAIWTLAAIMIVAVCAAAGVITVKVRK